MSFQDELEHVLTLEREGKARLDAARAEAENLLDGFRQQAGRLERETEKSFASTRREALDKADEKIGREVELIRQRTAADENRLRSLAEKNRERTVERVLAWLWEER